MENIEEKYYEQIIKTETHDAHWTQFELDLIRCIKDEHPIIYTKTDDHMSRHQRAAAIKAAWKQIRNKFKELPLDSIKATWSSILNNYLKVKIYADLAVETNDTLVKYKFMDGTLSFLEGEKDSSIDHHTTKKLKTSHKDSNPDEASDEENTEIDNKSYALDIREILHEEVDLDDTDIIEVKQEVSETQSEDNITSPDKKETNHPVNINEEVKEPETVWTEDELMNATRLTKEMIDQLILIKAKNYYMIPVVDK